MNQSTQKLLVSGEFWHRDFSDLIAQLEVPTTLIPGERLLAVESCQGDYAAILVAQSRRGSISQNFISHVQRLFPDTPVIVLLGSWCEGETRSGRPLNNVYRMFWHEWNGSYNSMVERLQHYGYPLPRGQSSKRPAEILREFKGQGELPQQSSQSGKSYVVGVSALTRCQFETLEEPLRSLGITPIWLEQTTWQATEPGELAAICMDSDGLTENLSNRIAFVREATSNVPLVVMMNFPRKDDVIALRAQYDVASVVSKPFDLLALWQALQSTGIGVPRPQISPAVSQAASANSQQAIKQVSPN